MEERQGVHKGFKIFIIIFTIFALLFINKEEIIKFFERKALDLTLNYTIKDDFDYRFFNGEIIKYNDNSIGHLDKINSVKTQKDFNFTDPVIKFGNEYIYYASGDRGDVYVLNNRLETVSQFSLNMNIYNIEETSKYPMVHSKGQEFERLLSIDIEGNTIYKNSPGENILNYDMGANTYAFSTISIGDDILSSLYLYDFQGQEVNRIVFENEVIFKVYYSNDNNIILLTDKGPYMLNNDKILWNKEYSLIKNILIYKDNIHVLYSNYLETLDFNGNVLETLEFEAEYDMMLGMEDGLILHGDKDLLLIKDNESYKLNLEDSIKNVTGYENEIIVNTDLQTYIYEIELTENEEDEL